EIEAARGQGLRQGVCRARARPAPTGSGDVRREADLRRAERRPQVAAAERALGDRRTPRSRAGAGRLAVEVTLGRAGDQAQRFPELILEWRGGAEVPAYRLRRALGGRGPIAEVDQRRKEHLVGRRRRRRARGAGAVDETAGAEAVFQLEHETLRRLLS